MEKKKKNDFFLHEIQSYDTLQGLALQYKIPVNYIKKFNKLSCDTILYLKSIKIPITDTNKQILNKKQKIDENKNEKEDQILSLDVLSMKFKEFKRHEIEFLLKKNKFDFEITQKSLQNRLKQQRLLQQLKSSHQLTESQAIQILEDNQWDLIKAKEEIKNGTQYFEMTNLSKGKLKLD